LQWLHAVVFGRLGARLMDVSELVDRAACPVASIGAFSLTGFLWRKCSNRPLVLGT
jgi:hypothetical protein